MEHKYQEHHKKHHKKKEIQKIAVILITFAAVVVSLMLLSAPNFRAEYLEFNVPQGLTQEEVLTFQQLFDDSPLQGGQESPFISKWVGRDTFAFLYFDEFDQSALKYLGIGTKGVFCKEAGKAGEFTDFRKWSVPTYAEGQGGQPGDQGYWMAWIALDRFTAGNRNVAQGVDYSYASLEASLCGNVPPIEITVPSKELSQEDIEVFTYLFNSNPLLGTQSQPWMSKWVNDDTFIFLQFTTTAENNLLLRYIGIGTKGTFCESSRPHPDFSNFHKLNAPTYSDGENANAGDQGYWMMWIAVDDFNLEGRDVYTGIDRDFARAEPPKC